MKVNIEIDDDSKFLEALAEDLKKSRDKAAPHATETDAEFEIDRASPSKFSCVAISCNG